MKPTAILPAALLVLAAVAVAAGPANGQPAIYNGTFDLSVPRNGTGGGWTSENVDAAGGWQTDTGNPAPSYRLNDNAPVETDPTLKQVVDGFTPGNEYTLLGDYQVDNPGGGGGCAPLSFEVRVDGVTVQVLARPEDGFQPFAVTFTATAASHEISLAAETNGCDHDYYVDNIRFEGQVPADGAAWGTFKARYR